MEQKTRLAVIPFSHHPESCRILPRKFDHLNCHANLRGLFYCAILPIKLITKSVEGGKKHPPILSPDYCPYPLFPLPPEGKSENVFLIPLLSRATHEILLKLVTQKIPEVFKLNPFEDIQILTPMQKGTLGVKSLNADLHGILNTSTQKISRFGLTFAVGDKVMQTINNYDKDIFNGDMGIIQSIDMDEGVLQINFDGNLIEYDFNELDEITLAYAITIHKSQGSEYPAVVIPLVTQHYIMLERNLLYTAVTRGKKLVVIVGKKKALSIAIKNLKSRERLTRLREKMINNLGMENSIN